MKSKSIRFYHRKPTKRDNKLCSVVQSINLTSMATSGKFNITNRARYYTCYLPSLFVRQVSCKLNKKAYEMEIYPSDNISVEYHSIQYEAKGGQHRNTQKIPKVNIAQSSLKISAKI